MNEGWSCPKCGRVYSPSVTQCAACNSQLAPQIIPSPIVPSTSPCPYVPNEPSRTDEPYYPWKEYYQPWKVTWCSDETQPPNKDCGGLKS